MIKFKEKHIMSYQTFLDNKKHLSGNYGFDPIWIPDWMFDFQQHVTERLIQKGRGAGFLDTGLGKTAIELVFATNIIKKENKPVLILTPLAVAFQFIKEADKFGIDDIEYSKDGKYTKKIVVTNYERLHYFDTSKFVCIICDESGILKNFEGKIRNNVTIEMRKKKYRGLFTATPLANDFHELGNSSEALGYMGYTDMLGKFFTNNEDTISPQYIGTKWKFKPHAEIKFYQWVSSWSISCRKPSDLGFSDENFILPELITEFHSVKNDQNLIINGQTQLFNKIAKTRSEVAAENRVTIRKRCEKAVELASKHETSVYWANLNPEADMLEEMDPEAIQINGPMDIDKKEEILIAFYNKEIKKLVTKPKITAYGLNWQHCNHTVYFPDFSYEKFYQALRRFWRFGQLREVHADIVTSDGQKRVVDALKSKGEKADQLFSKLNLEINSSYDHSVNGFDKKLTLPKWM